MRFRTLTQSLHKFRARRFRQALIQTEAVQCNCLISLIIGTNGWVNGIVL
jgi:hypothetical protein